MNRELQEVATALCWRKFYILTASIFPLRYDLLIARQILASPGTLSSVDRCREARHACPQSPEPSDLLFAPYSALPSPVLGSNTCYHLLAVLPELSHYVRQKEKLRSFLQRQPRRCRNCAGASSGRCAPQKLNYVRIGVRECISRPIFG